MDKTNFVFQCVHCNKKYKSETCYNKHFNICRFLNNHSLNNHSLNNGSEERDDIPNKSEMWQIILYQNNRLIKLEKELNKLKKYDYYQKKKISVIDYLNSKYKPNYSYEEWEKNITITQDDLNYIFEHGIIKGTVLLLKNYSLKSLGLGGEMRADSETDLIFDSDTDFKIIPIVSTNQTLGKLYIYSNNCWTAMNQTQFKKMLQIVNNKVFAEFKTWCIEMEKKMTKEKYSELYILNVEKLVSGKQTNQQIQLRIKTSMCNFLRIQLNNSNTYTTN